MRQGSKKAIAKDIIKLFPAHEIFIDCFFGAGGMFFKKQKIKPSEYNILNDLDNNVFNFFQVIKHRNKEFRKQLRLTDISSARLQHYKANKYDNNEIEKAIRFIFLSNFTFLSKGQTIKLGNSNHKKIILNRLEHTIKLLQNTVLFNSNWREFLNSISFRHVTDKDRAFIYADPPYVNTRQETYETDSRWTATDLLELLTYLSNYGSKFAVSEFNSKGVIETAKNLNLIITPIKERRNLGNRKTEILITNYKSQNTLFD